MLSYIFLTSFVAVINSALMPRCPSNTTQSYYDKKICYSFVTEAKNFADAETYCNSQNGNLVVIPNQFINSFVWSSALEAFGSVDHYWIGGLMKSVKMNAGKTIDVWGWTKDNGLMSFSDWDPSSATTGNCTAVEFNSLWSANNCSTKFPFVCELPAEFSYCDEGWTYFNMTNTCYKKFSKENGTTQPAAELSCVQKGGHLASIHSKEEDDFVAELTSIGYKAHGWVSVFWIGAERKDNSNQWYWTDDTVFEFINWGYIWNYTDKFCVSYWPDWTTSSPNYPRQWNADICGASLYGYFCGKAPNLELF